ncbi:MAG: hypothetical protein ACTHJR_12305 [Sphingomonas sp.]|uniref:hypothetical protein n=1 Tax=Sphingomonas sp. TaxID=28214 RepID=UPI003F8127B7
MFNFFRKKPKSQIRQAMERAADWLEANRDHHIRGYLSARKDGKETKPTFPDAECFCAVGRLCKEYGVNRTFELPISSSTMGAIIRANDQALTKAETNNREVCGWRGQGGYAGIRALRRYAKRY